MHVSGSGHERPDDATPGGTVTTLDDAYSWLEKRFAILEAPSFDNYTISTFLGESRSAGSQPTSKLEKTITLSYHAGQGSVFNVITETGSDINNPDAPHLWLAIANVRMRTLSSHGPSGETAETGESIRNLESHINTSPFDSAIRKITVMVDGQELSWDYIEAPAAGNSRSYGAAGGAVGDSIVMIAGPAENLQKIGLRLWAPDPIPFS